MSEPAIHPQPRTLGVDAVAAPVVRDELLARRRRLEAAKADRDRAELVALLRDVNAALERLDEGHFGLCVVCHGEVERERLLADPLVELCLDCLTPEQRHALQHDLRTAAAVQASLLPPRDVTTGGWETHYVYRPFGPVSGDYVDLILPPRPGDGLWFLFGDVAGKGVAASMLMASLHTLFRSLIGAGLPLVEVLHEANRLFRDSTPASAYATLVAGSLCPSGVVELASAGHPPPLLRQAGEVRPLPVGGLPLGLFAATRFESTRIELAPGDALFLYTDGLSETLDAVGEAYGDSRAAALLAAGDGAPAGAITARVLSDLAAFRGAAPPADDLTLMTVRRLGAG
jgi:sigma-B regulation protein RsbU (phosphoserine phosphatase)